MPPISSPLTDTKFTLDSSAVAGFFGGDEAISAMATVHLYEGRRWLGWFNSPGSYTIAKRFGRMANSRFWDGLFPGPNDSPAVSFGLDGKNGPEYISPLSGTRMPAGHLAYLMMERCKELPTTGQVIGQRETKRYNVGYLAMGKVDCEPSVKRLPLTAALSAFIPITTSIVTCIMCALVNDWISFSMILLGIVSGGLASAVIGNGELSLKFVGRPADGSPPGHGTLKGEHDVLVIKGKQQDVNAITRGSFHLKTGLRRPRPDEENGDAAHSYHSIGFCSLLLLMQFLVQLLLVPQGTLFGQIMFILSLVVSWGYNSYLSSLEKEKIQTDILLRTLEKPEMLRFQVGTRTTVAVFVCLLLFHGVKSGLPTEEERGLRVQVLRSCLPNDTLVWRRWTDKVVSQLLDIDFKTKQLPHLQREETSSPSEDDKLLAHLLNDAVAAFEGYFRVYRQLPEDSSQL